MINITTKEYLRQTFKLDAQINSLIQEIETMEAKATKVTTLLNPDRVEKSTGVCTNSQESLVVKMVDYKNLVNKKVDELIDLKINILAAIGKIDNPDQRMVLMLRYVNLKYFEQIAVDMNYSYRTVLRIHGSALQSFEKLAPNVT